MERILLVEPNYKNKYPPIGLMKIASYHKGRGDYVEFYKGMAPFTTISRMDRIYITSLFTFYFDTTLETIKHYLNYLDGSKIYIGGIAVSLMTELFKAQVPTVNILTGQLTDSNMIGYTDNVNIDRLPLDYDILDDISYEYPAGDNFFVYATRGCPRKCTFCAVKTLEPVFFNTNDLVSQIDYIRARYGDKRHILLMDNNVLFSDELQKISDDLLHLGFAKDTPTYIPENSVQLFKNKILRRFASQNSTENVTDALIRYLEKFKTRIRKPDVLQEYNKRLQSMKTTFSLELLNMHYEYFFDITEKYRSKRPLQRYVDFNQGIDARLLTDEKMELIADLPLRPFRLAYDNVSDTEVYERAFRIAYKFGVRHFSNYMLYNFEDTPQELWQRARKNIDLYNSAKDITAFSFPMKYAPIDRTDRNYIGIHWNKKYLSAMNIILNVTKGVMAREEDFFTKAYGKTENDFLEILSMPNEFIKFRLFFEETGYIDLWKTLFGKLTLDQRLALMNILSHNNAVEIPEKLHQIYKLYKVTKHQVQSGKVVLQEF